MLELNAAWDKLMFRHVFPVGRSVIFLTELLHTYQLSLELKAQTILLSTDGEDDAVIPFVSYH